jgi:carbonic anhydrase
LIERGSVSIHGAYFGVATGSLLVCDREGSEFVPVAQAEHAKLLQAPRF